MKKLLLILIVVGATSLSFSQSSLDWYTPTHYVSFNTNIAAFLPITDPLLATQFRDSFYSNTNKSIQDKSSNTPFRKEYSKSNHRRTITRVQDKITEETKAEKSSNTQTKNQIQQITNEFNNNYITLDLKEYYNNITGTDINLNLTQGLLANIDISTIDNTDMYLPTNFALTLSVRFSFNIWNKN